MTFDEVCATVGGPPGDHSDGRLVPLQTHWHPPDMWWARNGELGVRFDDDGRAYEVIVSDGLRRPQPSVWSRLRDWLGL